MGTAAHVHVSGRGTCAGKDRAPRPSLAATVDCISGQAARTRVRFAKLFVPTGGAVGAGNCRGSLAACRALAPASQTCTWLAMHASTAETCRAAGDRCSTWRREVNSERASWAPLTCTCGSGCCAPSDPPHAIATKTRSAPADCPFRVESRVLMATDRVSARGHPRFDRDTPPKTWQTCCCEKGWRRLFQYGSPTLFLPP